MCIRGRSKYVNTVACDGLILASVNFLQTSLLKFTSHFAEVFEEDIEDIYLLGISNP